MNYNVGFVECSAVSQEYHIESGDSPLELPEGQCKNVRKSSWYIHENND